MNTNRLLVAAVLAVVLVGPAGIARAQGPATPPAPVVPATHDHDHAAPVAEAKAADAGMMEKMKADEARLDALVTAMNAAPREGQLAALMAVVNELVGQHKAMHAKMADKDGKGMMAR